MRDQERRGSVANPQVGMVATVRRRRGIISSVEPFQGGTEEQVHLVSVEYLDPDGPSEDQLVWEREPWGSLLLPSALLGIIAHGPMQCAEFDGLVRATRWSAVTFFNDLDEAGPLDRPPISSPLSGAFQNDAFQLVSPLKAPRMSGVAPMLPDEMPCHSHTRSCRGLPEAPDPVRFTRTDETSVAERTRLQETDVRRLESVPAHGTSRLWNLKVLDIHECVHAGGARGKHNEEPPEG